jgi:hypothetical protein
LFGYDINQEQLSDVEDGVIWSMIKNTKIPQLFQQNICSCNFITYTGEEFYHCKTEKTQHLYTEVQKHIYLPTLYKNHDKSMHFIHNYDILLSHNCIKYTQSKYLKL